MHILAKMDHHVSLPDMGTLSPQDLGHHVGPQHHPIDIHGHVSGTSHSGFDGGICIGPKDHQYCIDGHVNMHGGVSAELSGHYQVNHNVGVNLGVDHTNGGVTQGTIGIELVL